MRIVTIIRTKIRNNLTMLYRTRDNPDRLHREHIEGQIFAYNAVLGLLKEVEEE